MRQNRDRTLACLLAVCALGACGGPPTAATASPSAATASPPTSVAAVDSTPSAAAAVAVPATSIKLASPDHFAFDIEGNIFLAACGGPSVSNIDSFGLLTVYPSLVQEASSGQGGPATSVRIGCAAGLALDGAGNLYVGDRDGSRIRRIDRNGNFSTVAGSGPEGEGGFGGDGGAATSAKLRRPTDIALDAGGNLFIADSDNNRIRMMDPQGIITTVAGSGQRGFSGDAGPATSAQLNLGITLADGSQYGPSIAVDAQGNLYITDSYNARIRKVDRHGIITTVAGTGEPTYSGDGGPATVAAICFPTGLAIDAEGNLYVATASTTFAFDSRIRKIDQQGIITTVVGTGEPYFSGDGGPALAATIREPWGIAFDSAGNLYIADAGNNRVRKVDRDGTITTVAGGRP